MRGFIDTHLCIGIAMKLPDGVVRMIYRKVEEQCDYQDEYDDLIEDYGDLIDDEDRYDLADDIDNLPSFVQYCRNWFWDGDQLYHH